MGADHQDLNNTRQLLSTGRSMVGRCSTAKVDFGLLTPNFPLFMNKQRRLRRALRLTRIGASSSPSGSGHSAATEEPAQSVTLPPTSPHHAIVSCGDTPVLQSPGDRRERGKRKPRLGPMSASQPQRLHQSEPRDSQQARGVPGQHDGRSAASTDCHETPQNVTT